MSEWFTFLSQVQSHLSSLAEAGCDIPFFRGHNDSSWKLVCGLGRQHPDDLKKKDIEAVLYYDFMSLAGPLLEHPESSWETLFAMRHHGLPTRLLDWSSTFAVALYFSLRRYIFQRDFSATLNIKTTPCVWVLDPFELNRSAYGEAVVVNPHVDLDGTYYEIFIAESKRIQADVLAINPTRIGRRLAVQRGVFTLHSDVIRPLEQRPGSFLKQFILPLGAISGALSFLSLSGMNEFSLFPDLDGLARYLKREHVDWL